MKDQLMKRRVISMILCICIVFSSIPNFPYARAQTNSQVFKDVSTKDWFYDSVMQSVDNNIFSGTDDDTFSPGESMTRGMYVTIMGRVAQVSKDSFKENIPFTDIQSDAYYTPYVMWAVEKGITQGTGDNKFSPDNKITREEMATFTARYFDAYKIPYPDAITSNFPKDLEKISPWAKDAVLKLWSSGLFKGDDQGNFNPKNNATRAEAAAFSVRINDTVNGTIEDTKEKVEKTKEKKDNPVYKARDGIGESIKYYNVKYNSNGGSEIATQSMPSGSSIKNPPTPYKENEIFAGWYYDAKLENHFSTTDVINKDIDLYAKYTSIAPLSELETPTFASSLDQGKDFKITVVASKFMANDEVQAGISCKNLSSKGESDFIEISGNGAIFEISGINGFEEGASYKLVLEDENLYFQGFETSVRNYNFTIGKEEVLNLQLNENMVYIPFDQVSNVTQDGESVQALSLPLAKMGGNSDANISDLTKGTFEYSKRPLEIGETITLYKGIRPDERTLDDTRLGADGDIAYLEITQVNGNTYSYKTAEVKDVLFRPDVLPVSKLADTDGDPSNYSITVDESVMEFSDDIYTHMQLDSQTSVDVGDYLAFYNGEFGENADVIEYGYIESIENKDGVFIISYSQSTMDEILAAMDLYNTDSVEGDTLLEGVDIGVLEKNVEDQARASGFADEAAMYLADLALKTDSFTKLSDDFQMTDLQFKSQDGREIDPDDIRLMAGGSKVEVELSKLQATISTKLKHFDTTGVRLTLDVGIEITISVNDDTEIVIEVTGSFEEEVRININVDGGAKWKWWGIFPYIADYEATANIDLYNFTGIGINATITTREKEDNEWTDNEELQNISEELKKLLDSKDKYIGDGEGTVADGLNEKYKAMLENESDWVTLFEKEIFSAEIKIPPSLGILVIEISGKFVVTANMNISIGCDFYYENAKRYIYTIQVFEKNVTSDVIDIREEHYEFSFYVMGTMGLRAGVKIEIAIGIISTKLGSVGVAVEVGVYTRVWGYFYYQLKYTASQGKSSSYSGALLFELGIYLEITFQAQALKGTFPMK